MKIIILLFTLLCLVQCGTSGSIVLPDGEEDISCYVYPPESKDLNQLEEDIKEEEVIITTKAGNIIEIDGRIGCRPIID